MTSYLRETMTEKKNINKKDYVHSWFQQVLQKIFDFQIFEHFSKISIDQWTSKKYDCEKRANFKEKRCFDQNVIQ